jgi:predicted alpha/beta hydrolase family esterase
MRVLVVPGLHGSGPGHWQTLLESRIPGCRRVVQADWDAPSLDAWVEALHRAVSRCSAPSVLVAHSLGCAAVVHLARRFALPIRAALLVAPADVEAPVALPASVRSFCPLPTERLPFASLLVASTDDPYLKLGRARDLARVWGSGLVVLEGAGHINVDSGHGPWPQAELLLERLIELSEPARPTARTA